MEPLQPPPVASAAADMKLGMVHLRQRRYQMWRGNNLFCCSGHLMFGSSPGSFTLTLLLIYVPFALHAYYVATYYLWVWLLFALLLLAFVSVKLFECAFTEPGIVPRNTSGLTPPPPAEEEAFDEVGKRLKFCETCQIWRRRRVKHCRSCDNCVQDFDHHCPWVGNCIGRRNYGHFVWLIIGLTALALYLLVLATLQMFTAAKSYEGTATDGFARAISDYPGVFIMMLYTLVLFLTLVGLLHYQCELISKAEFTTEQLRNKYRNHPNPYNLGGCANLHRALFSRVPPSDLPDLSEFADSSSSS